MCVYLGSRFTENIEITISYHFENDMSKKYLSKKLNNHGFFEFDEIVIDRSRNLIFFEMKVDGRFIQNNEFHLKDNLFNFALGPIHLKKISSI